MKKKKIKNFDRKIVIENILDFFFWKKVFMQECQHFWGFACISEVLFKKNACLSITLLC